MFNFNIQTSAEREIASFTRSNLRQSLIRESETLKFGGVRICALPINKKGGFIRRQGNQVTAYISSRLSSDERAVRINSMMKEYKK